MHTPLVTVVIPTCGRNDELARCLERLAAGEQEGMALWQATEQPGSPSASVSLAGPAAQVVKYSATSAGGTGASVQPTLNTDRRRAEIEQTGLREFGYEVVVSDDGRDGTAEAMVRERFPWARWVKGPQRGPAANRNCGADVSRGEWLAFTDDDCVPAGDWLLGFATSIQSLPAQGCIVLEGRTVAAGPKTHPFDDAPINERGGLLWSCNLCVPKALFVAIDGFDERFPYAALEDVDLRIRLEERGAESKFAENAVVMHPWKRQDVLRHWRRHLKSQMIFIRIHPDKAGHFGLEAQLRTAARYYLKQFLPELHVFGWLALRCQPLRWYGFLLHAWVCWRRPDPEEIDA